jgi:hypothetical protein
LPTHGGLKNTNAYAEGGRQSVNEDNRFYGDTYAPQRSHPHPPPQRNMAPGAVLNERYPQQPQHYFQQQGKSPFAHGGETQESAVKRRKPPEPSPSPPPLFGQIHTFSASGSLRGSGDAQEQQGRYPSRNSYDNYMQIYANNNGHIGNHNLKDQFPSSIPYHPHQQGFRSSPTTLPKVHVNEAPYIQGGDRSNGALVEINGNSHGTAGQSTRESPNFTIYHNPIPRQSVPAFSKSGTVVLGGNTSIHITHNSHGGMKKYEQEHGVGRSAYGRNSARSVFRNTATPYSHLESSRKKASTGEAIHDHPAYSKSKVGNQARRQDHGYYRENDNSARNAPSPSSGGGVVSTLLTPSRQQIIRTNDDLLGMATPSILDLPEDSPQRILLSFRTPSISASHSFDWRDGGTDTKVKQQEGKSGNSGEDENDNAKKAEVLSPPENRRLTQQQSHAKKDGVGINNKTPTASPTSNRSLLNSSFSLSALPSPPRFTNSNGEQIEIANSFSLFNASSFDSLAAECPQLQKRDKGDDIISLSQFGSAMECRGFSKQGEYSHGEVVGEPANIDSAAPSMKPPFSLGVDICMGIGTMPTVGMSRSNSGSMSLIDFGPMTSQTESFVERRSSLNVTSMDGFADVVHSPPKVVHQYSSNQRQQNQQLSQKVQPCSQSPTKKVPISTSKNADHDLGVNRVHMPNQHRSNSYGSNHSSSTSGSGSRMYPDICIASGEVPMPGFYYSLIRMRRAFEEFSFLLPGLKMALERDRSGLIIDVVLAPGTDASVPQLLTLPTPSEMELIITKRRVVAAVCAFGGSRCRSKLKLMDRGSIFRNAAGDERKDVITGRLRAYDDYFSKRYYENEHRISWAFEETPPVISSEEESFLRDQQKQHQMNGGESISLMRKPVSLAHDHEDRSERCDSDLKSATSTPTKRDISSSPSKNSGQPKMRYRCKLCGQPKQNHVCPYQQSLQRSIGISVRLLHLLFLDFDSAMLSWFYSYLV